MPEVGSVLLEVGFEREEMHENPGEFEVRDCDGSCGVVTCIELILYGLRPFFEPCNGLDVIGPNKPDASYSPFGRVDESAVAGGVLD